jgi:Tol biopolymer transport system component
MRPVALVILAAAILAAGGAAAVSTPPIVLSADNLPAVTGEIYRLDANGHRVDLSKSPFRDEQPLVAPDGRRVAFVSNRSGHPGVYSVRLDGTGLLRLDSPPLQPNAVQSSMQLAWAPNSKLLAVVSGDAKEKLSVVGPGRSTKPIARADLFTTPAWSPDSRVLTLVVGENGRRELRAFTPAGRPAWRAPGDDASPGWSSLGLLATIGRSRVTVYDEGGHTRFRFPGRVAAWSPDGRRLASVSGGRLEARTAGGRRFLSISIPGLAGRGRRAGLAWLDSRRVLVNLYPRVPGVDTTTGKRFAGSIRSFYEPRSPDGRSLAEGVKSGSGFALKVSSLGAPGSHVYGRVPGCFDDGAFVPAISGLQFVPRRPSLVYESLCAEPFAALYAVQPDGSGLRQLTHAPKQQVGPAWSPDGTRIAYTRFDHTGLSCKGCPGSLTVAGAAGTNARVLTTPQGDDYADYGPSWSPDGTQILFSRSNFSKASELLVVPAAGGAPRDLHVSGSDAAWGPARIAYIDGWNEPVSLWTALPDGSDRRQVEALGGTASPHSPAWAPDGRLAFLEGRTAVIVSGGAKQRVELPFEDVSELAWSPDGSRFLVTARLPGSAVPDLYSVRTDGSDRRQLTKNLDVLGASWR